MQQWEVTLHVDGGGVYGDLQVSGFATQKTAEKIGDAFKETLKKQFPNAQIVDVTEVRMVTCGLDLKPNEGQDGN